MQCIYCDVEMIKDQTKQSDLRIIIDNEIHYTDPIRFFCPKCGLVQTFLNENFLDNYRQK